MESQMNELAELQLSVTLERLGLDRKPRYTAVFAEAADP